MPVTTIHDRVLDEMADVFAKRDLIGEIAPALSCREANAIARGLLRLGRPDAAAVLIAAHAWGDDDLEDEHRPLYARMHEGGVDDRNPDVVSYLVDMGVALAGED